MFGWFYNKQHFSNFSKLIGNGIIEKSIIIFLEKSVSNDKSIIFLNHLLFHSIIFLYNKYAMVLLTSR